MTTSTMVVSPAARLERPALQRLLRDIEAGKIDAVVCYKIDRLIRSLTDFANWSTFSISMRLHLSDYAAIQHNDIYGQIEL